MKPLLEKHKLWDALLSKIEDQGDTDSDDEGEDECNEGEDQCNAIPNKSLVKRR